MNIPKHIKAVIFDMDGLLIDSEPIWIKADADFFSRHGKKHTPEVNHRIMGMGHKEIMKHFKEEYGFIGDDEVLINQRREILLEHLVPQVTLMEGARALIELLQKNGYPMAIATGGYSRDKSKELLDVLGIGHAFQDIITADQVQKGKPAPDIFLKAAASLKIIPEDCLVFEDAPNGVLAGKAAGMTVYAVNSEVWWKRLKEVGADQVFSSLAEVTVL